MARPGIMLYFDIRQPLEVLPYEDKGRLFDAILEYGELGTIPEFDGMLAMAWGFIQPKLDRDSKEYERTVLKRQYATFCREIKRKGAPDVPFDEWVVMSDDERQQMLSHDAIRYPTTTVTPTAAGTTTGTSTVTPSTTTKGTTSVTVAADVTETTTADGEDLAAAAADRKLKKMNGELGQGVVNLTEFQIDRLLNMMGVDMFDYYVKKLADFIIHKDASVKNHFNTIIKWWTEDSSC